MRPHILRIATIAIIQGIRHKLINKQQTTNNKNYSFSTCQLHMLILNNLGVKLF